MKKKLLMIGLLAASMLTGCTRENNPPKPVDKEPESVNIAEADFTLKVNETKQLTATVLPEDAIDKSVSWSTSASDVASVTNGLVTALKAGESTITVATVKGNKTDTVNVEVRDEVKKSVLKATFNEVIDTLWENAEAYYATEDIWEESSNAYYNDFDYEELSQSYTLKNAIDDAHTLMSAAFDTVYGPKAYTWSDGSDGYEACYKTNNGVEIGIGDYVDEGTIVMQVNVYPAAHYDLVKDATEDEKTYEIDLTKLTFSGNLYDQNPPKQLTEEINRQAGKEILSSIEGPASQIMSIDANSKQDARKYVTIGSGSSDGYVKFHFLGKIKSVTVKAQAYNKYIDYTSTWSIDANAKCFLNSDANDLGITVKENAEPDVVTKTFTFDSVINYLHFYNKAAQERVFILGLTITLA